MKLSKIEFKIERTLDQHVLVFTLLVLFLFAIYASNHFAVGNNCHALNPSIDCTQRGTITRSEVMNNCWINVSTISLHGMDEYRELPSCADGLKHAKFERGSNVGTWHYDKYNAVNFPLGSIDHFGDFLSIHTHINESLIFIGIWGVIFFGGYYIIREFQYIGKKLNLFR